MTRAKNSTWTTTFVDEINVFSLAHLVWHARACETIWHFDPICPATRRLLGAFQRMGLIGATVRRVDCNIGLIRNAAGKTGMLDIRQTTSQLCLKIREEQLVDNDLIQALKGQWSTSKILLYFDKLVEQEISVECLRIALVEWMVGVHLSLPADQCDLLIRRRQWFRYLEGYAAARRVRLRGYRGLRDMGWAPRRVMRLFRARRTRLSGILPAVCRRLSGLSARNQLSGSAGSPAHQERSATTKIATRYWHRKLGFDPTERTEFFWLDSPDLHSPEILLYDYVSDEPLDAQTVELLKSHGIKILGRGPGIPFWVPTPRMVLRFVRLALNLAIRASACGLRRRLPSSYYIGALMKLSWDYAYWYDFYSANGVRVNVATIYTTVGQVLALDALNGVSLAYQVSVSEILYPNTALNAGEDVHFIYSPCFERMWNDIDSPVRTFVHTGLLYGDGVQEIRGLDRVASLRKQIESNGAKFVLCFLDQNSHNRWDVDGSNDEVTADYEFLLQWLLSDPTLGILFKPKSSSTLFLRIDRISDLIRQANETGRCEFLISEFRSSNTFPLEAAAAADVCIGVLGSTAPLETSLAGIKTVLVDAKGFVKHPFYAWCRGRIAYGDWESLRAAVECFRADPEGNAEFGEWLPQLANFDSFRDGRGGARMGSYIGWLNDSLNRGESKEAALKSAEHKYSERWGDGHITAGTRR